MTEEGHTLASFVIVANEKAIEWEDTALKGVKQKVLGVIKATGEFARLVKIEEGVKVPQHTHSTYHIPMLYQGKWKLKERRWGLECMCLPQLDFHMADIQQRRKLLPSRYLERRILYNSRSNNPKPDLPF